jgi:hypothetical protein
MKGAYKNDIKQLTSLSTFAFYIYNWVQPRDITIVGYHFLIQLIEYVPIEVGEAGAGGVLYSPRGNQFLDFSWNLGKTSNNMVEAYAIYQGILLAQEQQLKHITIVGDSKNIIHFFVLGTNPKDAKLKRIIDRSRYS